MKLRLSLLFALILSFGLQAQYPPQEQFSLDWLRSIYPFLNPAQVENLKDHDMVHSKKGKKALKSLAETLQALNQAGFLKPDLDVEDGSLTDFAWERRVFHFKALSDESDDAMVFSLAVELEDPEKCESWRLVGAPRAPFIAPEADIDLLHAVMDFLVDEASDYAEEWWLPANNSEREDYHQLKSTYKYGQGTVIKAWAHVDNPEKRDYVLDLNPGQFKLQDLEQRNILSLIELEKVLAKAGAFKAISVSPVEDGKPLNIVRTYQSEILPHHIIKVELGPEVQKVSILDVNSPVDNFQLPGAPKDASGNTYPTSQIGDQTWTGSNASFTAFNNGDPIHVATDANEFFYYLSLRLPVAAYPDFDKKNEEMGLLYSMDVLTDPRGFAPEGYHASTVQDWEALLAFLNHPRPASFLKSEETWPKASFTNNHYQFNAMATGYLHSLKSVDFGETARFWALDKNGPIWHERYFAFYIKKGELEPEPKVTAVDLLKAKAIRFVKNS